MIDLIKYAHWNNSGAIVMGLTNWFDQQTVLQWHGPDKGSAENKEESGGLIQAMPYTKEVY